ncbi:Tim44/TimA family putative adaptor protein [Belnapia rosea]|uniref:Tim44/TimA family putative adaptor protein n=1 Tax=Belnapia rosea TaxID=938405 RepID=UPI00089130A7|nr:Tim44/TimA family putative adaptor protein [Belnapia rosea]SDB70145.1 Predicted lipid-binding transport protein, Tim44 family [Belnapia rosea]
MTGGFPVDLILFAMIAAFLVLRLRSVLGKRTGFERPVQPEARPTGFDPRGATIDGMAEEVPAGGGRSGRHVVPDPRTPPGQALSRIASIDHSFEPNRFLDGAEAAFRMIVSAFGAGDRTMLRPLLSDDTYAGFEQAITARENAGETQRTELRAVHELAIEAADLRGSIADITVRFVTDQINMTMGRGGEVVTGSDAVTELTDLWTFQRDLSQADPTWKLVATRSA